MGPKRRLLAALLTALCLASPLSAAAAEPAVDAVRQSAADRLVRLLCPPALVEIEMPVARRAFDLALESDASGRDMKTAYPELPDVIWDAVAPELRADFLGRQPELWSKLAPLYAQHLTTAELEALSQFYASETGQKMLRTMYTQADYAPMIDDILKHPDTGISKEVTARVVESAKAKTIASVTASMTDADKEAYERLGRAVPRSRVAEVSKQAQVLILAWVNQTTPARDARVEKIVTTTVRHYLATHKRAS